ncbi:MAG: tail assembly protein [Gammaproteobacteria bacterium]|nr:tail assembly protein [Gammaproteobacteria bacterium]
MVTVKFYGELQKFGKEFTLDVKTPGEAVHALICQIKGLRQYLSVGGYFVKINKKDVLQSTVKEDLNAVLTQEENTFSITPAVTGAGEHSREVMGGLSIVAGIALVVGGIVAACFGQMQFAGPLIAGGIGLFMSGVTTLMSKQPDMDNQEDKIKSSAFNGLGNRMAEGGCVPIAYGCLQIGSKVISQSIESYSLQKEGV